MRIFMITMLTILVFLCVIANWGHASPHSQKRASDRAQASLRRRRHGETQFCRPAQDLRCGRAVGAGRQRLRNWTICSKP